MRVYALLHRVLFHDTMAYGTHHFLTNFRFQCEAREHLFFGHVVEAGEEGRALHARTVILTREAYAVSLGPAALGERVVILLTVEAITERSLRFCFRVVGEGGRPVTAGYQTMVAMDRQSGQLVGAPAGLRDLGERLREPLQDPELAARLHAGRAAELFDPDTLALAAEVLARPELPPDGLILERSPPAVRFEPFRAPRRVLLLPGQGSYDPALLRALVGRWPEALEAVDALGRELLGASLSAALAEDGALGAELSQLGIYLLDALGARAAREEAEPDAVLGHSLGEIPALVVGGALSLEAGARVVAARARALRGLGPGLGGMLALLGSGERARALLDAAGPLEAWLAVQNHPEQVVISGRFGALERLEAEAARAGLETRRLRSPWPFHCPLLAPAVEPFAAAIAPISARAPELPVYSASEGGWFGEGGLPLGRRLARQLVAPLDFAGALRALAGQGATEFVEAGGGSALIGFARRTLGELPGLRTSAPLQRPRPRPPPAQLSPAQPPHEAASAPEAIAVVGVGCVLPNARSLEELWAAVLEGRSGIVDAGERQPDLARDFLRPGPPSPDKTYSILGGFVLDLEPRSSADVQDPRWSLGQRMLAEALCACREGLAEAPDRIALGSTADGSRAYDEALLLRSIGGQLRALGASDAAREAALSRLSEALAAPDRPAEALAPHASAAEVARAVFGREIPVTLVDAACASSLYALELGVRSLRAGHSDLVFCGGLFAPGPANSCLFSQFRGLSASGSWPLDARADGVVFGEGAVVLALRRHADAVARGEPVLGLIRAVGVSSDGRGPSVALPRAEGQVLAMRRAWAQAGLDPADADLVEAHATATPVGDAVELGAIGSVFGEGRTRPLTLGSLKSLTGHTGWAAGAASVLKVLAALRSSTLPPQRGLQRLNPRMPADRRLVVPTDPAPWPAGEGRRRAGVNGFGFGGSDAHVLLEEAGPPQPAPPPRPPRALVVVGVGAVLPGELGALRRGEATRIAEDQLTLPPGPPILPDVLEDMDRAQRLAVVAAARALPPGWEGLRATLGVALGLEGKTERSLQINQRLYLDRICRALEGSLEPELLAALIAAVERIPRSGPYTLPGLMPNVAAGRVSSHFDLQGPNLVLDAGRSSLPAALAQAAGWLAEGTCELVLAGALSPTTAAELEEGRPLGELGLVLALCEAPLAEARGWRALARLTLAEEAPGPAVEADDPIELRGARGALQVLEALTAAAAGRSTWIRWGEGALNLDPAPAPERPWSDLPTLRLAEPRLIPDNSPMSGAELPPPERCLLLVEDELPGLDAALPGARILRAGALDLSDDEAARRALRDLDPRAFDALIAVRSPGRGGGSPDPLLELLFVAARHLEGPLSAGQARLGTLSLGGVDERGRLHPGTGSLAGLVRSLARGWPEGRCRALVTEAVDPGEGLRALARAWASPVALEIVERGGFRARVGLVELLALGREGPPCVGEGELVLATGGARGVTALLVEALLTRTRCRVALLGRSRPEEAPPELVEMDDADFAAWEPSFYARRRAEAPGLGMAALRAELGRLSAAREAARTLRRLAKLGDVSLLSVDLRDAGAVGAALGPVFEAHGRPALVLHGAGVQDSGALARKRLEELRAALDTKLGGLDAILAACAARFGGWTPPVHALGSAFSSLGNDGQHGYGAANEALMRRAAWTEGSCTLAWPGWAGVGMTRGSEYAALARARGLRPLLPEEGQALFLEAVAQQPAAPAAVILSEAELRWAGETLEEGELGRWPMSVAAHPHTEDHLIEGRPTLPGTFGLELLLRGLQARWPGWTLLRAEDLCWEQFARLQDPPTTELRARFRVLRADAGRRLIEARLVSDLIHPSGHRLAEGRTHLRARLLLVSRGAPIHLAPAGLFAGPGRPGQDPYVRPGSAIGLGGLFRCVEAVEIFPGGQQARVLPPAPEALARLGQTCLPALVLDALCRVAMFRDEEPGGTPVFFPYQCRRFEALPGHRDQDVFHRPGPIRVVATRARGSGEAQESALAVALDGAGVPLLRAEGLIGRFAGRAEPILSRAAGAAIPASRSEP